MVDNHASTCMSDNINHFVKLIFPINNHAVKGYVGMVKFRGEGTIKWKIEDDNSQFILSSYTTSNKLRNPPYLLSPHQWAQKAANNHIKPYST